MAILYHTWELQWNDFQLDGHILCLYAWYETTKVFVHSWVNVSGRFRWQSMLAQYTFGRLITASTKYLSPDIWNGENVLHDSTLSQLWIFLCLHLLWDQTRYCWVRLLPTTVSCWELSFLGVWRGGHEMDRVLVEGWLDMQWLESLQQYQARTHVTLNPRDLPVCDLFWGGIPCKFLFCTFHFELGRRFWRHASVLDIWTSSPRPSPIPKWYARVWTRLRGNPLQNFNLHFSIYNWGNSDNRISILAVVVGLSWAIQSGFIPSDWIPHWFEGSVSGR